MNNPTTKERILDQIRTRLYSRNAHIRKREWRQIAGELREKRLTAPSDVLTEFLTLTRERVAVPGMRTLSPRDYHKLSDQEKLEVDSVHDECLKAARRDFPDILQGI